MQIDFFFALLILRSNQIPFCSLFYSLLFLLFLSVFVCLRNASLRSSNPTILHSFTHICVLCVCVLIIFLLCFFFFSLADCALYLSQYIAASVVWHQFTRDRDQNNQSNKQKCYLFCCCYCCYHLVSMLVYSVCHLVNERIKYHTFRWCKSVKLYPNHTKSAYFFRIYHQKNKLSTKKINKSTRIKNDALFTLINLIEIPRDFARLDFSRTLFFFLAHNQLFRNYVLISTFLFGSDCIEFGFRVYRLECS